MNTKLAFRCKMVISFVCLATLGCSDAGNIPDDPIGQFDDGTYEIFDGTEIIGIIYAHHDYATIASSYEFWKFDAGRMDCLELVSSANSQCNLSGKTIRRSAENYYSVTSPKFPSWWTDSKLNNAVYLRARYLNHPATDGGFSCPTNVPEATCTYAPPDTIATTNITMFPTGTSKYGEKTVIVAESGTNKVETWFMDSFFSYADKAFSDDMGASFTHDTSMMVPCSVGCSTTGTKVDVTYSKCKQAPTNTGDCTE
jgi:hypothetical protein